jgi:AGZA family xanthine/uracil permease-like MFS transporter
VWGILAATVLAFVLLHTVKPAPEPAPLGLITAKEEAHSPQADGAAQQEPVASEGPRSKLATDFRKAVTKVKQRGPVALPPSMAPTFLKMDLPKTLSLSTLRFTLPFILIFLFMDVFDTLGTLIGVGEQAGLIREGNLPRMKQALVSDAVGTAAGAAFGTSTVTSFIESAAGVEQGGRTGLTGLVVALLFLLALFFSPLIEMVGNYPPITAAALVLVGSMMMRNVTKIDWPNYAEAMPAFLIIIGIPLTYSIADGLALGFIAYPIIKPLAGQGRDVKWLAYVMALVLIAYLVLVRAQAG